MVWLYRTLTNKYNRVNRELKQSTKILVAIELLAMSIGPTVGQLTMGSQRYIVYPLLVVSILLNYYLIKKDNIQLFKNKYEAEVVLLFCSVLIINNTVSIIVQQRTGFEETLIQPCLIVLGVLFAAQLIRLVTFSRFLWIGYSLIIFTLIIYASFIPQSTIRGTLFDNLSSNALTAHILWLLSLIYCVVIFEKVHMPILIYLIPGILTMILSLLLGGRSGAIFSALAFCGALVSLKYFGFAHWKKILVSALVLFAILFVVFNVNDYSNYAIFNNFLSGGLESSDREEILKEYLSELTSPVDLLFGVDLNNLPLIAQLGHPHNSYIRLYSYMGLIGFFLVVMLLIYGIACVSKGKLGLLLLLIVFPARVATDSICFMSNYDFVFYMFCIIALYNLGTNVRLKRKGINY